MSATPSLSAFRAQLKSVIATLLVASVSFGQVTVRPGGDLQAAIDLVPDGG